MSQRAHNLADLRGHSGRLRSGPPTVPRCPGSQAIADGVKQRQDEMRLAFVPPRVELDDHRFGPIDMTIDCLQQGALAATPTTEDTDGETRLALLDERCE